MEASLIHTHLDTSKMDPFNGTFFKRWQERVFSTIDVVNLGHILTDYHLLINDLVIEDIKLHEPFVVGYLVETFPKSWKDYKNNMKHKRKQMSLKDVIIYIRIEEQN